MAPLNRKWNELGSHCFAPSWRLDIFQLLGLGIRSSCLDVGTWWIWLGPLPGLAAFSLPVDILRFYLGFGFQLIPVISVWVILLCSSPLRSIPWTQTWSLNQWGRQTFPWLSSKVLSQKRLLWFSSSKTGQLAGLHHLQRSVSFPGAFVCIISSFQSQQHTSVGFVQNSNPPFICTAQMNVLARIQWMTKLFSALD